MLLPSPPLPLVSISVLVRTIARLAIVLAACPVFLAIVLIVAVAVAADCSLFVTIVVVLPRVQVQRLCRR